MPLQYERIRDSYLKRGKPRKEAESLAAATYNARHPDNPEHWAHGRGGGAEHGFDVRRKNPYRRK